MDEHNIENSLISNNSNANTIDVMVSFPTYKFNHHHQHHHQMQQASQSQHYLRADSLSSDYSNGNDTLIDMNNNYGAGLGVYGASFPYFNDPSIQASNNNNNNLNFPNQNYKIPTKYATNQNQIPTQFNGINVINTATLVNSSVCQYAHNYGGASCYNRNRFMPYNHNRACAAAAAAVTMSMGTRTTATTYSNNAKISTAGNNVVAPPLLYTSYQQFASAYPNFIPVISQPTNVTVPHIGMDASNPYFMSAYEPNTIPTAQVDCTRYASSVPSNFTRSNRVNETDVSTCLTTQQPLVHSMSIPCTSGSGSVVSASTSTNSNYATVTDLSQVVSLRLTNLDHTMDEESLRKFLLAQLKPITPVVSLIFEDSNFATVTVPDSYFAKQVVANLHRKKIGHKRMVVSYTRDSSFTEANTLRCQVAGLLKDVPHNRLPMYKFRELFQSRFKTSISVLDLYTMRDICMINSDGNEEKFITLLPNLVNSLENSPLMEGLQHTVPYCKEHFKREQHKGWAEQEIEPLPNVLMTVSDIQNIIYPLLKNHHGDIPVSSLVHCIEGQMNIKIEPNENGVNLEHLVCCTQGIKIQMNNFGIKILSWLETDRRNSSSGSTSTTTLNSNNNVSANDRGLYFKGADPLNQITREVIELIKMSPKSTMKFSRFIPAYHNHFGKQCRVADYGYTKLIELFEALSSVVQIMGDGENRQITLTHRTQIRRFTSDLLRILRSTGNKSILLSELPEVFVKTQNRNFDVTEYGVCDIGDILDGLVHSNVVVVTKVQNGKDILISIPKRQQTVAEIAKTCVFAGEMVELFQNAPQYTVLFQKFVRSYHYHFSYQCRLSDYGFLKLADLMESIHGVVEMDRTNDEDRRVYLSPIIARRVFAEQCEELIRIATGSSKTSMKLKEVLKLHKKKYGYQMLPETLGVQKIKKAIDILPYVEMHEENEEIWITCHNHDPIFRTLCYRACKHLLAYDPNKYRSGSVTKLITDLNQEQKRKPPSLDDFIIEFNAKYKENLNINMVKAMRYAIEIFTEDSSKCVRISEFMNLVINIVRLLEQRSLLLLSDIKIAMNCTISTTFPFGYPNLYTLLAAYPDIFIVNMGVSQESSEVRLAPNCELLTQRSFSNTQKSQNNANNTSKLTQTKANPMRAVRTPLAECNVRNSNANYDGPPSAKIRNIMSVIDTSNIPVEIKNPNLFAPSKAEILTTFNLKNQNNILTQQSNYNSFSNVAENYASCHNSTLLNSSFFNSSAISNKENLFNNSFNNISFNSSNNSFIDSNANFLDGNSMALSSSISTSASNYSNTNVSKLWDRRHDIKMPLRQQPISMATHNESVQKNRNSFSENGSSQNLPPLVISHSSSKSQVLETPLITRNSLYNIVSSLQNGPPGTPLCDPPKPDSPPNNNVPFWIDPIWSNGTKSRAKNELVTIKPSDENAPMVLSPYTLSKIVNINTAFNFDSSDRKIA